MRPAHAAALAVLAAAPAWALDSAQWPPPDATAARMHELQQALIARDATPAQREAAREELSALLKSPAGQQRGRTPDEKPARAAVVDPIAVKPVPVTPAAPVPPADVARLEVVAPPKPIVMPHSGSVASPINPGATFAIDPRTGQVLHGAGGVYIDPRTGQVTPR